MALFTPFPRRWRYAAGLCAGLVAGSFISAQAQTTISWTGAVDTIYTRPGNWNLGRVPNPTDNVLIPVTARQPALTPAFGIGQAGNLTIASGARLRLNSLSELDLYGSLTNNGTFGGKGALVTKGTTAHTIGGAGSPITLNDLVIDSNAPATLNMPLQLRQQLVLSGNLTTTTSGPLTLLSTPSLSAFVVNNGTSVVIGQVTVQRAIDNSLNPGVGYRHYSTPVNRTTVNDFTTSGFLPTVNGAYNASATPETVQPFPTVFAYDQARVTLTNSTPAVDKGYFSPFSLTDPLLVGRGYAVNLDGSQLVDFVGILNSGDVLVTTMRNGSGTANEADAGWQLLGNPYPAPLDYRLVDATDRAGLDAAIYVYRSTGPYTGMYRSYTNGVGGNPVLPIGQGFFARRTTSGTTGTFTFRNAQRLITPDNTPFQRPTTVDLRPQLELTLSGSNALVRDYANVYFEAGSTGGVDTEYDAVKKPNPNGLNLSTLTASGEALAIDGRPVPTGTLTVPLQVFVPTSGTYTLHANQLLNLAGTDVYLHDRQQGTFTNLNQQPSYTFTLNAANVTPRFELVFGQRVLSAASAALAAQVSVFPNPARSAVAVELPAGLSRQPVTAALVDALGRVVRQQELPIGVGTTHQLALSGLAPGVYGLRLRTAAGQVVKRLVIE